MTEKALLAYHCPLCGALEPVKGRETPPSCPGTSRTGKRLHEPAPMKPFYAD